MTDQPANPTDQPNVPKYQLEEIAFRLAGADCPLRRAFGEHLALCAKALHDIEWVDSGDYGTGAELNAIKAIFKDLTIDKSASQVRKDIIRLRDKLDRLLQL